MRWKRSLPIAAVVSLAACVPAQPPAPPPAPVPAPVTVHYPAPDTVWTDAPDRALLREAAPYMLPRPFTRLEVLQADSTSLFVQCSVCGEPVVGWIGRDHVIHEATSPDSAAVLSIAEFALAVRQAAVRQDPVALDRVLAPDFTFSSLGGYGRDLALSSWRSDNYRTFARMPSLLDRGLSTMGTFWVAPPDFADHFGYTAMRLGFQRTAAGRWEWVFAVAGELEP